MQNASITAFTVFELLRENQQEVGAAIGGGGAAFPPPPPPPRTHTLPD